MILNRIPMAAVAHSFCAGIMMLAVSPSLAADEVELVRDGRIQAVLLVAEELEAERGHYAGTDPGFIQMAIDELAEHLQLIGEGEFEVLRAPSKELAPLAAAQREAGRTPLVLAGPAANASLHAAILEQGDDAESFALEVDAGTLTVIGLSPKGVLNGVYDALERVGFRWYMPGEFGRVVPRGDTHGVPAQRRVEVPSFMLRSGGLESREPHKREWCHRVRNSLSHWNVGHGIRPFVGAAGRAHRGEKPEWFAMLDGQRGRSGQLCVSNPDLLDAVVAHLRETLPDAGRDVHGHRTIGMTPQDGGSFCECENCRALDPPINAALQSPRRSVTDRYIWFINLVLDRVGDEFPDLRVGFLIYAGVMDPPVNVKPDPRIFGSIAEIHVCRIHGPGNPNCPESDYLVWLMEEWGKHLPVIRNSGYWFNLACPHLPFMMISRMRTEIPMLHELGSVGISRSVYADEWSAHGPSRYLATRLSWDIETDVDSLLDEFFELFYGPAAEPMKRYTMLIDRALHEADHHTGRSWDLVRIYDESVRRQAREAIDEAQRLADEGLYATRVEVAAKGWAFFEAFADVLEMRSRHDFVGSMRAVERTRELIDALGSDYEYPMVRVTPGSTSSRRFFDRFFALVTEQAYERVTDGNELIVGLSSEWEFLLEPQGMVGERIGLYEPHKTGGNWQKIDTSTSWSNQGLRYYFGEAWYRQRVTVPENNAGKKTMLWFSHVDSTAKVWLNGKLLGTNPGGEFDIDAHAGTVLPFEFDVTDVVRPGEQNVVVVRAARTSSYEIGTGGLMGPVMFYASAD